MRRLVLIHWNQEEAERLAAPLREAGFSVDTIWNPEAAAAALRNNVPHAFVISLDRLPSQGMGVATWLRQRKATRAVPILFAGGKEDRVARARKLMPDALFAEWDAAGEALRKAAPLETPVVPNTMEGYAGTPLLKKLGIKPGTRVALLGAPRVFELDLPEDATLRRQACGEAEVVMLFAPSLAALAKRFPSATKAVALGGRLWIVWPKKASGISTDLTQNEVRRYGLDRSWVDYKIAAIDATWSGLAFARRKKP